MKIERVKQRDFVRNFVLWKEKKVEIIGKNDEIIGYYAGNLSEFAEFFSKVVDKVAANKYLDKCADDLSKKIEEYPVEATETVEIPENVGVTDTIIKVGNEYDLNDAIKELYDCQRCDKGFADLWIVWEDGEEHKWCRMCLGNSSNVDRYLGSDMSRPTAIERYLSTLEKVDGKIIKRYGKQDPVALKPQTKADNFNPQPKPVKSKKKKK